MCDYWIKLKKSIYWLTVISVVPCLIYYTSKFAYLNSLSFENSALFGWTIIICLILFNIFQTFVLNQRVIAQNKSLDKLHDENQELKEIIIKNHYQDIAYQKNTREIIMMEEEEDDGEGDVV